MPSFLQNFRWDLASDNFDLSVYDYNGDTYDDIVLSEKDSDVLIKVYWGNANGDRLNLGAPTVTITDQLTYPVWQDESVILSALVSDPQEGDLSASTQWYLTLASSSNSDFIVDGASAEFQPPGGEWPPGTHTVEAIVTDSEGNTSVAKTTFIVQEE